MVKEQKNLKYYIPGFLLLFFYGFFLISCSKEPIREKTPDPVIPEDSITYTEGFLIINEGNFNWGNASVTHVNPISGRVVQNVFKNVNNRNLGDVAQSMKTFKGRGFIVVNNSNRVEVINLHDFSSIKSIEGFHAPRYIEIVDSTKAYVTNLYKDISVVDLNTLQIVKTISTPEWTEGLTKYQNYMFVTCIGAFSEPNSKRKAKIMIIDTKEDKIIDSIQTGKEPLNIVIDKKMKLWVLCSGGYDGFEPPALLRINPDLRSVEKVFSFTNGQGVPSKLCINQGGDTLYFLYQGIFRMSVASQSLPDQPFISSDGQLFYSLAIHPADGTIFATDAVDYVQSGWAYQFNQTTGEIINSWMAGRIPGSFCFGENP